MTKDLNIVIFEKYKFWAKKLKEWREELKTMLVNLYQKVRRYFQKVPMRVLYVGDAIYWEKVGAALQEAGILFKMSSTVESTEAILVENKEEKIDLIMCEFTLKKHAGGLEFAEDLRKRGYNVIVFSRWPIDGFPYFDGDLLYTNKKLWMALIQLHLIKLTK